MPEQSSHLEARCLRECTFKLIGTGPLERELFESLREAVQQADSSPTSLQSDVWDPKYSGRACVSRPCNHQDIEPFGLQTTPLPEEAPDVAQRFTKKDVSSSLRNSESGMIDQVMVTTNVDGQRFVKVKARLSNPCWLIITQPFSQNY